MARIYEHQYLPKSVYGNVVNLLATHAKRDGVHIDVGCGYGAIAEPIHSQLCLTYLGFDLAEDGLASLRERGFEASQIDLSDPPAAELTIRKCVGSRTIASISFIDTLEHITNGSAVVAMLRRLAGETECPLVLSVPNVAHKDLALKLLVGRWDVTEAGLLDHTHVEFYTASRLQTLVSAAGWIEIGAKDWLLEHSDQKFPSDLPILDVKTPLGGLLRQTIDRANQYALVNQFVRAFLPSEPKDTKLFDDRAEQVRPFLSVVVVLKEADVDLSMMMEGLSAQSCEDFEVRLFCLSEADKIREQLVDWPALKSKTGIVECSGDAAQHASSWPSEVNGRYISFIRPTDQPLPQWIEAFKSLAPDSAITVLRVECDPVGFQSESSQTDPEKQLFDFSVFTYHTPSQFALPAGLFRYQGLHRTVQAGEFFDDAIISRCIIECGARGSESVAVRCLAQSPDVLACLNLALSQLQHEPILLPPGSAALIRQMVRKNEEFSAAAKEHEILSEKYALFLKKQELVANCSRLTQFIDSYISVQAVHKTLSDPKSINIPDNGPFISIITRTQGLRAQTLRDTLLSLAGQTDQDYEHILVLHSTDEARLEEMRLLIAEFPLSIRERISLIVCDRSGRAAPLNDGLMHARGRYITVLDDDDFVFAHWIETFKTLSQDSPHCILRATCTRQDFELSTTNDRGRVPRALSWFKMVWPNYYDAVSHLHANFTPFMSLAFPIQLFRKNGLRFDESLSTTEDWELTQRAAMICDVKESKEVTAVYRWWMNSESSAFSHASQEWDTNRERIIARMNSGPVLLPAGAINRIVELIDRAERLESRIALLGTHIVNARLPVVWDESNERLVAHARQRLAALLESTSWKVTRPLRRLMGRLRGAPSEDYSLPDSFADCQRRIIEVHRSTSWWVTKPLRFVARLRRGRHIL